MVPVTNDANAGTTTNTNPQVLCLLPSGQTAVCSANQCVADGGQIQSKITNPPAPVPVALPGQQLFRYQTPHGIDVIGTQANAETDHGTILGPWNG